MKASELREKSVADLTSELEGLLKKQFNNRMEHGVGQLAHTHELKRVRREIARVKTVLAEKQGKGEA